MKKYEEIMNGSTVKSFSVVDCDLHLVTDRGTFVWKPEGE